MTLSDIDLEARLRRDLRARGDDVPPAPAGLAEATRRRHRSLRRRQLGLVAAGVAAALVLVGVPVISASLTAHSDRGQAARPTGSPSGPAAGSDLYDAPTRGGLADDDAWLTAMAAVEWSPSSPYRDPGMELAEPVPTESRRVAYADDVPSGRVALVVGLSGRQVVHAWFVGPRGAEPGEMTSADFPGLYDTDVVALVDGEAGDETLTLVVVARPDAVIERPLVPVVDADGNEAPSVDTLDLENGIAVVEVDRRWAESGPSLFVRLDRANSVGVAISDSPRAGIEPIEGVVPADPRGLAPLVEPSPWLQDHAAHLLRQYGLTAQEAEPTLLAAGPVSSRHSVELLGITFPSGATGLWLTTFEPADPDDGTTGTQLPHAPAGTDLLERVVAVRTAGGLVVSAPSGIRVDVLDASGVVLESLPLTGGAGTGALADPAAAVDFRVVDGAGNVVAEGPIEVID
jgi:hypothetical protein